MDFVQHEHVTATLKIHTALKLPHLENSRKTPESVE